MAEDSLSRLCKICHINLPKYTCPRCTARTCSLPCSRQHKLWAECSGVRDPAAYIKQQDLVSPAAFDKDYNFLTGVERSLERADRDAENRGIYFGKTASHRKQAEDAELSLLKRFELREIDVIRAPKGMTRSKQNMTNWHKKRRCLNWTLEFVFPGGERAFTKCVETDTIGTAFSRMEYADEHNMIKRPPKKKRKRQSATKKECLDSHPPNETDSTRPQSLQIERERSRTLSPEVLQPSIDSTPKCALPNIDPNIHFYLHRPRTRAQVPVLLPISQTTALCEALRGRSILEFPTVYVLSSATDGYVNVPHMLEEDYLKQYGTEDTNARQIEERDPELNESFQGKSIEEASRLENIDESRVLEVLKQDVGCWGQKR